jgi:hypothetical protein
MCIVLACVEWLPGGLMETIRRFLTYVGLALPAALAAGNAVALGPISETVRTMPADLKSPLFGYDITKPLGQQYQRYRICVYNAGGGKPPGFTFTYALLGSKTPVDAADNHGGHVHAGENASPPATRPVGDFRYKGSTTRSINSSAVTAECAEPVDHLTPRYSGKASAELLVTLPDGWRTVYPEPLDASYKSWKYLSSISAFRA